MGPCTTCTDSGCAVHYLHCLRLRSALPALPSVRLCTGLSFSLFIVHCLRWDGALPVLPPVAQRTACTAFSWAVHCLFFAFCSALPRMGRCTSCTAFEYTVYCIHYLRWSIVLPSIGTVHCLDCFRLGLRWSIALPKFGAARSTRNDICISEILETTNYTLPSRFL